MATSEFSLLIVSLLQVVLMIYAVYHALTNKKLLHRTILLYPPLFVSGILLSIAAACAVAPPPLACALGIGGYLGFIHPAYGLSLFTANLLMRPWETLSPGNRMELLPRGLALICILGWIFTKIRERSSKILLTKVFLVFMAFAAWLFISAAFSFNSSDSLTFVFGAMFPPVVILFIVFNSVRQPWSLGLLIFTLIVSICGISVVAILETLTRHPNWNPTIRLESFGQWGNANDLALLLVTGIALVVLTSYQPRVGNAFVQLVRWLSVVILLIALWSTQSRGSFLALAAGFLPLAYDHRRDRKTYLFAFLGICAFFIVLLVGISRDQEDMSNSETARFNYVITGMRMLKSHPLFGVGPSNYPLLYDQYTADYAEGGQRTAHSSWVLIASESGPIGFLLFLALVISGGRAALKSRSRYPGVAGAYISYFVAATFLSQSYSILTFLIICIGVATQRVVGFSKI